MGSNKSQQYEADKEEEKVKTNTKTLDFFLISY